MKSAAQASITPEQQEKLNALLLRAAQNREGEVVDSEGLTQTVLGLLKQGADINAQGRYGKTALMFAASAKVANDLLTHPDVNINLVSSYMRGPYMSITEFSALAWAAQTGNAEVVDALLKSEKFDVNESISVGGLTPFIVAANADVVKVLARHPALEVNKRDSSRGNVWTHMSKIADEELRERKFAAVMNLPGIDLHSPNQYGDTPLILAADFGYVEMFKSLLANHEVDANVDCSGRGTVLHRVLRTQSEKIAKPIVDAILESERVTNINAFDKRGFTALMVADIEGYTTIFNQIIVHTATSQKNDGQDWRAMMGQLYNPQIQNRIDRQTASLLAVIMPEVGLENSIVANFNVRNPDSQIDQNEIAALRNLRSHHVKYLNDSEGMAESKSHVVANKRSFDLINDPAKKAEAIARDAAIEELASKAILTAAHDIASLAYDQPLEPQMEILLSVARNPEERFRLKDSIIAHNLNEKVPSLQALSLCAALDTMAERLQPSAAPSEAETDGPILPPQPPERGQG